MTLVGWCPGGRPVADMLDRYQRTRVVRIFVGRGKPLPSWSGPVLGPIVQAGAVVHLSFKTNPVSEVVAWVADKPAGVLVLLSSDHEPEQQEYGDPTVEQYHATWAELVQALAEHPMRDEILLGPVYTRYWWQAHPNDDRWLVQVPVDFVGWDVYSRETDRYRTPDDLLSIPRQLAARTGLPYLVAELGAVRIAGDTDGSGRQAWMRAMVAAANADGAWTVCWYHREGWDLAAPGSEPEQQTWRELIAEEASMAWIKGQPWRVVRSLERLNAQIRAACPLAVPPATPAASWGAIADSAHSSTSDHYPHFYSALGATAVVCARDFPHAPELGLDAHALADKLRVSRDPRIGYVISNGRITGPSHGWQWDTYSGSDPHDTHIHVSTVHTAAADDPQDWQIGQLEDDIMATLDELRTALRQELAPVRSAVDYIDGRVEGLAYGRTEVRAGLKGAGTPVAIVAMMKALGDALGKVDDQVAAQLADDFARIDAEITAAGEADEQRDQAAAAKLAELTDLVRAGQSGQIAADEVLRRMGEVLTAGTAPQS